MRGVGTIGYVLVSFFYFNILWRAKAAYNTITIYDYNTIFSIIILLVPIIVLSFRL